MIHLNFLILSMLLTFLILLFLLTFLILLFLLTFLILSIQVLVKADMRPNSETGLKLIVPPKEPADRKGRRRATLIVCPTSLMSHWVEQLHSHLHKSVAVKLKVHHGNQKAFYAADLETHDIVITTYGTLAAEFVHGERSGGPLLRAKWLRVVMDEGHMIKNHLAKCHKAALELDTLRRYGDPRPPSHDLLSFPRAGYYLVPVSGIQTLLRSSDLPPSHPPILPFFTFLQVDCDRHPDPEQPDGAVVSDQLAGVRHVRRQAEHEAVQAADREALQGGRPQGFREAAGSER